MSIHDTEAGIFQLVHISNAVVRSFSFQIFENSQFPRLGLEQSLLSVVCMAIDIRRLYGEELLAGVEITVCGAVETTSLLRTKWRMNGAVAMLSAEATVIAYICDAIPLALEMGVKSELLLPYTEPSVLTSHPFSL